MTKTFNKSSFEVVVAAIKGKPVCLAKIELKPTMEKKL